MSALGTILIAVAEKVAAPVVKSILVGKLGGSGGGLVDVVIDKVADKLGVEPDAIASEPSDRLEEAVRQVEADAPELLAVWQAGLEGQFALLQAEQQEGFWPSAWRWGWMYLLAFLWVCAFLGFPILRASGVALDAIDTATLMTLTGWFISLYMGGHTVKEIGKQALEAVKTWRGAHV